MKYSQIKLSKNNIEIAWTSRQKEISKNNKE